MRKHWRCIAHHIYVWENVLCSCPIICVITTPPMGSCVNLSVWWNGICYLCLCFKLLMYLISCQFIFTFMSVSDSRKSSTFQSPPSRRSTLCISILRECQKLSRSCEGTESTFFSSIRSGQRKLLISLCYLKCLTPTLFFLDWLSTIVFGMICVGLDFCIVSSYANDLFCLFL